MKTKDKTISVVMLGATGAVGTQALNELLKQKQISKLSLLGRRPIENIQAEFVEQHNINIFDSSSYESFITDQTVAICTLGVGEPSKVSKEDFIKIDKQAVLDFAKICKQNGVKHFELLASVNINENSSSFYLRTKGELVAELQKLQFDRLSIFEPSMILTPSNRYGLAQAVTLKVWPKLNILFQKGLRKYRGIEVEKLGKAFVNNIFTDGKGFEVLQYDEFNNLMKNNKMD